MEDLVHLRHSHCDGHRPHRVFNTAGPADQIYLRTATSTIRSTTFHFDQPRIDRRTFVDGSIDRSTNDHRLSTWWSSDPTDSSSLHFVEISRKSFVCRFPVWTYPGNRCHTSSWLCSSVLCFTSSDMRLRLLRTLAICSGLSHRHSFSFQRTDSGQRLRLFLISTLSRCLRWSSSGATANDFCCSTVEVVRWRPSSSLLPLIFRIYCAGVFHNMVLVVLALIYLLLSPIFLRYFYTEAAFVSRVSKVRVSSFFVSSLNRSVF